VREKVIHTSWKEVKRERERERVSQG
jgi:hypothetical protein